MGFKLDLSKMKYHKSDKNSTTFQHPNGHLITIAHKTLAPENKSLLADVIKKNSPENFDEGGKVAVPPQKDPAPQPDKTEKPVRNLWESGGGLSGAINNAKKELFGKAEGGEVKMAGGGYTENNAPGATATGAYDAGLPCLNPNCKSQGKPHPNCRCYANMADGGEVSKLRYCAHGKPHMEGCEYASPNKMAMGGNAMPTMYAKGTPKPIPPGGVMPQAADDYAQEDADTDREVNDNENYAQQLNAPGANPNFNSVTGQMQQPQPASQPQPAQQAPQAPPQPEAPAEAAAPQPAPPPKAHDSWAFPQPGQNQAQHAEDVFNGMNEEASSIANDFNSGQITPKTYGDLFHNKDTVGKLGSIFGLLLSGAGSGLAHQQNMALQMMDKIIDRDIEAQKNAKQNQLNFLSHANDFMKTKSDVALQNMDIGLKGKAMETADLNNKNLALNLAKNTAMLGFVNQLTGMNANMPPGPNQAAAQQATGAVINGVHQKILQNNMQAAKAVSANAAAAQATGPTEQEYNDLTQKWRGMGMLGMEGADKQVDYRESHMIPGVGWTTAPATEAVKDRVLKINNFQNLLKEAQDLAKAQKHGAWTPAQKTRAHGIEADLVSSYNDVKGLSRFTKNEEALYENVVPNMSSNWAAFNGARGASLDRLVSSVQQKKNLEYKQAGVRPFSQSQQQSQQQSQGNSQKLSPKEQTFLNWAQKHPQDPRSAAVLKKLGK